MSANNIVVLYATIYVPDIILGRRKLYRKETYTHPRTHAQQYYTQAYTNILIKFRWCPARDWIGSQTPVTWGGIVLQLCISSYIADWSIRLNSLGRSRISKFTTFLPDLLIQFETLHSKLTHFKSWRC